MANIIVLFEVRPTHAGMKKYLDLAAMLKPMFAGFEGFIRAERFSSLNEDGNEISIIVPCHRVVGTNGSLTGYAGGIEKKVELLKLENVDVKQFSIPRKGTAL